ncbi:hypothetical protein QQS21_005572 [Conoideocrella luteorostrata]|uniref:Myb-like domain-containing protein n=1 Tax=Conoideocrella luteorostrata TaxID=1105319 RepID=A0AAJ0CPI8_9HYPO|nr:hypothetical protein QQS21_005572 [Conoideocrella luteorostrata]
MCQNIHCQKIKSKFLKYYKEAKPEEHSGSSGAEEAVSDPGRSSVLDASCNLAGTTEETQTVSEELSSSDHNHALRDEGEPSYHKTTRRAGFQPEWTVSEDFLLTSMKESEDNLSWADIGTSLNRGKNNVKNRWKIIKDCRPGSLKNYNDDKVSQGSETAAIHMLKSPAENACQGTRPTERKELHYKGAMRENKTANPGNSNVGQYLYRDLHHGLYPPDIDFEPHKRLSPEDYAALATINSKSNQSRMLKMQANFLNVAGKHIPISCLCEKLQIPRYIDNRTEANKLERIGK